VSRPQRTVRVDLARPEALARRWLKDLAEVAMAIDRNDCNRNEQEQEQDQRLEEAPARKEPRQAGEIASPPPEVADDPDGRGEAAFLVRGPQGSDYFTSGSFSPAAVEFGGDPGNAGSEDPEDPEEEPRPDARQSIDDDPSVMVQFGEDPGTIPRDEPRDD
jgi:hypothetical protein